MILGWTVLASGGIMAIDDYNWPLKSVDGTTPKEAIDLFLQRKDYTLLHKGYQVWIQKK
jgi:hypothetical protein